MANCELSFDKREFERADLVLFQGTSFKAPSLEKPDGQVDIYPELILHSSQIHVIFWTLRFAPQWRVMQLTSYS